MTTPDTDETALLNAVRAAPLDDTPRVVYADFLDEQDGVVECGKCLGTGNHNLNPYELAARYGTHRAGLMLEAGRCGVCDGRGTVPNGAAARAAFIRCQVELARHPGVNCGEPYCSRRSPEGLCDDCTRYVELRRRERELWEATGGAGFAIAAEFRGGIAYPQTAAGEWECRVRADGADYVVRRGFVDEIHVGSLESLFGETCSTCDVEPGIRRYPSINGNWIEGPCNVCSGTGRTTPGIAAAVFAAHPVTRVVVGDREPNTWEFPGPPAPFAWHRHPFAPGDFTEPDDLPFDLWDLVGGASVESGRAGTGQWKRFTTRAAALDALSRAVVDLARRRAGLGPVGWPSGQPAGG